MKTLPSFEYLSAIGNTPLFRMNRFCPEGVLYAKAEWYNPGGSVKDRAASHIIEKAAKYGELTQDQILLDATSGNTGIAYAMIGAVLGYRVKLCMPESVTRSRRRIISAYGAELVLTDAKHSSDGAIREAQRLVQEDPDLYFYANQYANEANWKAHFKTTGPEIYAQTEEAITHFVAGVGTSGTLMGVGRYLKKVNPKIQVIEVQPDQALHGIEGWKHMESAIQPDFYDSTFADVKMSCSTEDAYQVIDEVAKKEGLLLSVSSAASLHAARQVACDAPDSVVATVLADNASKYLEEKFWDFTK